MTARDELVRDIEITNRLLQYTGYSDGLRQRLLDQRTAMVRELDRLDGSTDEKLPPRGAKVIEFPGRVKAPRKVS